MRKLLNTLYVTNEMSYLSLDGENLIIKIENKEHFRIPFQNIENIVCFNYMGCSPKLMGKCVENNIPIVFLSPQGNFLAKVFGETKGNVFLRISQIDKFRENALQLTADTMATKFYNTISLIKRSQHDIPDLRTDSQIIKVLQVISEGIEKVTAKSGIDEIIGIEGNCAREYFSVFNKLLVVNDEKLQFNYRSKRPPLDPINAVLSFIYTMHTNEYSSALETVGLDSYIGYCHSLRSGRSSLACDMVEETRSIVERFVLGLFNLRILNESDFYFQISGAVYLNEEGRKKVITKWQEKKKTIIHHSFINEKIPFGLLPYVQSNLMAKYIRGDIPQFPHYVQR